MPHDQEKRNEYMRKYLRKHYRERRAEIMARLGGKCSKCGAEQNLYICPKDSTERHQLNISNLHSMSEKRLTKILPKCHLLCSKDRVEALQSIGVPKPITHGA